jgi:DNA-binding Lrp family transcriptional regulator
MNLGAIDRRIVAVLTGDLPEGVRPFARIAARLGISEEDFLARVGRLQRSGALRRLGATVDHRKLGFHATAMAVWRIPEEKIEEAARAIVRRSAVTHCYQREMSAAWPYNLYAVVHGKTRADCQKVADEISREIRTPQHKLLFSVRELKKSSPAYFGSANRGDA